MPTVACPTCDARLKAPESAAGKSVKCPKCGATIALPAPAEGSPSAPVLARPRVVEPPADEPDERPRPSKRSRRRREEDGDDDRPSRRSDRGFRCPYCGTDEFPTTRGKTSSGGCVMCIVGLFSCLAFFLAGFCLFPLWLGLLVSVPLSVVGLLMRENYRECSDCGMRIGG